MKTDTKFPLWLWLIGYAVTLASVYSQDVMDGAEVLTHVYMIVITSVIWPVLLGFLLGDVWTYVHP